MITSIATNSINDIYLNEEKNLAMVTGIDAVLQDCEHKAKAVLGEMILQIEKGLPYFETVWDNLDLNQFNSYFKQQVSEVNGVVQVLDFNATAQNNVLSYTATIETIYGVGSING